MVDRKVAVLRADASSSIGVGHVMRSLSLGEALLDEGFGVELISCELAPDLQSLATEYGINVVELPCAPRSIQDAQFVLQRNAAMVVVDGYEFSREFFAVLEESNTPFAVIDDNAETKALAPTFIINQNPHANTQMYTHMSGNPRLFLGLQYALLRREVCEAKKQIVIPLNEKVFVALGGSDTLKLSGPIVLALKDLDIELCVAIGPTNNHRREVEEVVRSVPRARLIRQVDYINELASSSLAILAAGSSLWEAAALGVPSIGLIVVGNQSESARAAERHLLMPIIDARVELNLQLFIEVTRKELSAANRKSRAPKIIGDGASVLAKLLT